MILPVGFVKPTGGSTNYVGKGDTLWVSDPDSNGSATIHAVEPGVAKITVTASGTSAASEGAYETMAEPQAGQTGSASFYLTVAENTVEVEDGVYYKLVTQLTEGKYYLLVNARSEDEAYALRAPDSGTVMTAPTTVPVWVSDYNSRVPCVLLPSSTSRNHIRWQYIEVDYSRGYGVLKDADRTSRLAIGDIGANDRTALELQAQGTAGMLGLTAADIADKSASYELTGLTLKYQDVTLTTNYTLKVRDSDTDPVHPEPGSVEVDKDKDTTEYNYEETGVARVDLTVSGVPMSKPVDVLLIDELAHPNTDSSLPDISLAISEFNNYTYFGEPNTFEGSDDAGKPYEPFGYTNYNKNNVIQDYTSIYEMQNFNPAVLVPKSGTNYDVAFQVAYETVKARQEQHPEREQIVIFMTDGICYQYNYMSYRTDTPLLCAVGQMADGYAHRRG